MPILPFNAHCVSHACERDRHAQGCRHSKKLAQRGEHHVPETHLIPLVLQVAAGQRDCMTVFGDDYDTPDGTCIRDYIHVLDLAAAHLLAMGAIDTDNCTYHLGNGGGFSVRQVIETARAVTGRRIPETIGQRRPGDPPRLVANSDKIRRELGWQPQFYELEQIVSSAWLWHQANPKGYAGGASSVWGNRSRQSGSR